MIETIEQLIAKFDKLTGWKLDGKTHKTLISSEGWEISYSTKIHSSSLGFPPVQIVINIRKDGQHVQSWGCMDSEGDQRLFVDWYIKTKSTAQDNEFSKENRAQEQNQILFDQL